MVLSSGDINIIADMEGTTGIKLHNNKQKLRNRFDIIRKLGQGTYGKVQLAVNKDTGEEVAIKTIRKSKIETEQDLVRIQREIQIMSSVQHPHIIHIYEVFENKEKIVLVMEYASGGELYDYLSYKKFLEEHEARRVFRQVAAAVYYCHKNMICHRDLKLENILLDEKGNAKIADFGLSNVFNDKNFLNTFCGSPLYASPEIVQGTPYFGPEVDCWSLGVLLYTLVYGAMPFDGSNFKRLVKQISEGDYYEPKELSDASSLIRKMLTVSPTKRANIDYICTDEWVDTGEEVALVTIAEEFCQLMPVRLDYLLALTSGDDTQLPPVDEAIDDKQDADKPEKIEEDDVKLKNNIENLSSLDDQTKIAPNNELSDTQIETDKDQINEMDVEVAEAKIEKEDIEVTPESNNDAMLVTAAVDLSKDLADNEKDATGSKEKSVGVKRISSFVKKSATPKAPIAKTKTTTESTTKTNGVTNKFGRLKKSGSESEGNDTNKVATEKKPWAPAAQKSSSMKMSPLPTSPTTKYSRLSKTGSLDKPDDKSTTDITKPPLRGTRVGSPVKQFHDSNHHKGCTAAADSQKTGPTEAKKSPSKSVLNKRASPVPTREVSPKKYPSTAKPSPTQRDKESPKKQIGGARPRSPVKTVKPTKSVPSSPQAESGELMDKPLLATAKRGSIDIAPLPTPPANADESKALSTEQMPQVSFMPKDKGGFTLLGVKSEVMFDVENSKEQDLSTASTEVEKSTNSESDKIIKYVATVKKHGKDWTKPESEPERVTLLNLKCSPSEDQMSDISTVTSNDSRKEQRGYNMYRSKYKSIQKFRSVVEHQVGRYEDETEVHQEETNERKEGDVEHCDSFSSAGSNDDLEDVFESLNSETLFSSLLNRTRNLVQRLSSGHIGISANSSGSSTFSFSTPGISVFLTRNGQSQRSSVSSENTVLGSRRYGRSTSRSSQDSEQLSHRRYLDDNTNWERRSRYEDFMATSKMREDPGRELISSFLRNRNPSLDAVRRPRSYYGSVTTGCLPGSGRSRDDLFSSAQDKSPLDQHHRYTKSYSRQVSEESVKSSSTQSSKLQRPRSFNSGNNHSNTNSTSNVQRDYSRSVSQTGEKSVAEEEEIQHEHHISEDKNQRSEIKKECKRSVSISESRLSSLRKEDSLSRQDSGIESMYDVNSPTSGVTDKSAAGRPPPVREEDNCDHPLARKYRTKPEDEDDDNSSVSHETGSVGSDSTGNDHWANSTSPSHISPSRNCEEESVGDRIRRKSFYARFNETRNPRSKARKQNSGLQPPSNSHLRHLLLETDPFLESRNSHYDSYHQGEHFTHHRSPSQRWSMHLHSPTGSGMSEGMNDYFSTNASFNVQPENSSTLPRRSSFTGASNNEEHSGANPSVARTHSLPEDAAPPDNNAGSTSFLHNTGSLRRPRRLDLYDRNAMEEPFTPGRRSWRQYSTTNSSSSSFRDPLEPWETPHYNRQGVGTALSSLMDSLESPSDVLQKAMELCDSLRKVK
ncbi:NUAK SNF1-like kinase 2 [Chamberlinius hualienensis]